MKKTWLKLVLVFVSSMVLLCSCSSSGGGEDDVSAEGRLDIDGSYGVEFSIGTCVRTFDLIIGDQPDQTTRFGSSLGNCYLYVPDNDKSATYIFNSSGIEILRTVEVSGDDRVTFDDSWIDGGIQYTSQFELNFHLDLKTFTISGSVNDESECTGDIDQGLGTNH